MDFYARGIEAFEQGRARTARNRLADLTSAYMAAPAEQRGGFAQQFAAIDPQTGFDVEKLERDRAAAQASAQQTADDKIRTGAANFAQFLMTIPDPVKRQQVASVYAPKFGDFAPQDLSDDGLGALAATLGGGNEAHRPMVVAPGSALVDPRRGVLFQNPARAERFPIVNVPDGQGGTISMRDTPQGLMPLSGGAAAGPALPFRVNLQGLQPESVQQARAMIEQDMGRALSDAEWAQISGGGNAPRTLGGGLGFNPAPTKSQFTDMTPEQVAAAGLPEGTVAQRNPETQEIKTVRLPDAGTMNEQREIRARAPRLSAVVRSLSNIQSAVSDLEAGKSTFGLVGTGPVDQLVAGFTPEGDRMNQAVSELQANLMALTRVPGIGTQSDLETRLDALRYPSTARLEGSNRQSIQSLALFINDLAEAYEVAGDEATAAQVRAIRPQLQALISGQSQQAAQPATTPAPSFRVISRRPAGG